MKKKTPYTLVHLLILTLGLGLISCSDAADYDDPQPDVTTEADAAVPADLGSPQDTSAPSDEGLIADQSTPDAVEDITPTGEDILASDIAVVDLPTPQDTETPSTCACTFKFWATQPLPQTHAWLTGDFLETEWADSPQTGAQDMDFQDNGINAYFHTEVVLEHTQVIQYKYIVGWPDNPGPHWAVQSGDIDPSLPNSTFSVDCSVDCLVGP